MGVEQLWQVEQARSRRVPTHRAGQSWRAYKDRGAGWGMGLLALLSGALLVTIGAVLVARSWPLLSTQPPAALLSQTWRPSQGLFGFWPFIAGSLVITAAAMVLAVPAALLSAIYLAEYSTLRNLIKPLIDLLASIPSVIYGLWGVLFVVPLVRDHLVPAFGAANPTGYSALAGGIVLAIMVFPIIVSVTEEVLRGVPQGMREASLALGATEWETTKFVVVRKALPGIIAAVVLGFSRAFGETLAVLMVAGNVVQVPHSLFDAAYTLPALIANNYGEMMSIPMYDAALMFAALVLLAVVVVFNIGARMALSRVKKELAA